MSNQIVISSGAKVRSLEGVLTGTAGIVNSVPLGGANGVATLDSNGKVPLSQLPASVVTYLGTWNAATNTPTLTNGTGDIGDLYICNVAGTVNFGAGPITFAVGDWVIYNGSQWQKSAGQNGTVTSVAVTSTGNDAISITGSPITTAGTINIGFTGDNTQYVNGAGDLTTFPTLTGYVPYTGATTDVDLGVHVLNAQALHVKGTAGAGHLGLKHQSAAATGSANESLIYANVDGDLAWQNDNLYLTTLSTHANTANRVYTFPDLTGTMAMLEGTQTFSGAKTFSSVLTADSSLLLKNGVFAIASGYTNLAGNNLNNGLVIQFYGSGGTAITNNLNFNATTGYNYTFPSVSGTIALTSNLSSYVPYTGATGNVNLGSNNLTASNLFGETSLNVKILASGSAYSTGYSTFSTLAGKLTLAQEATSGNLKAFTFDFSAWSTNTSYTYTLPAANGTIALTSDLSNYVPYTGATSNLALGSKDLLTRRVYLTTNNEGIWAKNYSGINQYQILALNASDKVSIDQNGLGTIFGGTIGNGTYTYTLPSATGTIALTSDIPSLTNYVTLTGASQTISSSKTFTTFPTTFRDVVIDGSGTSASGVNLKIATGGISSAGSGYTLIYSSAAKKISIYDNASNTNGVLDFSSITTNVTRTYAYPDANGTLALTSDIPSLSGYVPYTGATGSINLGIYGITAYSLYLKKNGTNGAAIIWDTVSGLSVAGVGQTSIGPSGTNAFAFNFGGSTKAFFLDATNITSGRNFLLPDANGTLVLGTGTTNYHAKFTASGVLGNSLIQDDGTNITLGTANATVSSASNTYLFVNKTAGASMNMISTSAQGIIGTVNDYPLVFRVNDSAKMYVLSSGNVGIGTSSPSAYSHGGTNLVAEITNSATTANAQAHYIISSGATSNTGSIGTITWALPNSSASDKRGSIIGSNIESNSASAVYTNLVFSTNAGTSPTERMRITSGGDVCFSCTSVPSGGIDAMAYQNSGDQSLVISSNGTGGSYNIKFYNSNGQVGSIVTAASLTSYNTTSDYRLKEDFKEIKGLQNVSAIKVYDFKWKSDDSRMFGVIAHELAEVIPYAVVGEKNAIDENGKIKPQGVDYSLIVPILVKAIQELSAKVTALENK